MCSTPEEFKKFRIKDYKFWHVELRSNQNYLGWCLVILNRHLEDLMDISAEEKNELFSITKDLRNTLRKAFNPDMINYASLGNVTQHVHLQVVPRYKQAVEFEGMTFEDKNWGGNYSPYDKNFKVSGEVYTKIIDKIKENL